MLVSFGGFGFATLHILIFLRHHEIRAVVTVNLCFGVLDNVLDIGMLGQYFSVNIPTSLFSHFRNIIYYSITCRLLHV